MTSRYACTCKFAEDDKGDQVKTMRLRLVLRGFMDWAAFDAEIFSGAARRSSQRLLASEAACHSDWILASPDIDKASPKGRTPEELAAATGEEGTACFMLPPGSALVPRTLPGFSSIDESKRCLQCLKPGTGAKDAPRAFPLELRTTAQNTGLVGTSFGPEVRVRK